MYKVIFSDDYYVPSDTEEGYLEWNSEKTGEEAHYTTYDAETKEEAREYINKHDNGQWYCLRVEDSEGSEIFENTTIIDTCRCCGHTRYDSITSDYGFYKEK